VPQDQGLVREGGEGQRSEKFEREVRSSGVTAENLCRLMQDRRWKFPDSVDELQGGPRERTGSVRKGRLFPNHGDDFVGALRERDIQSVSDCRMQQESDRPRERNVQVREVQQGISELQVSPARLRKTVVRCDFVFFIVFVRSDEYRGLERQPMGQFVFVRGGKNFGKNVTRSGVGDGERYGSRHCYFPRSEF
jgi:hypothetical protein